MLFNSIFYYSYTHKLSLNSGNFEDGAILVDTLFISVFKKIMNINYSLCYIIFIYLFIKNIHTEYIITLNIR